VFQAHDFHTYDRLCDVWVPVGVDAIVQQRSAKTAKLERVRELVQQLPQIEHMRAQSDATRNDSEMQRRLDLLARFLLTFLTQKC
jgi:hypothetical protein